MKTQYFAAASLDGFIATEDDSLDWLFPLGNINDTSYPSFIAEVGALALGANTYRWMVQNSEKVADETGSTWPYTQPAWVFSNRPIDLVPNGNISLAKGSVRAVHEEMVMAANGKNVWIIGGGDLAGQFHDAGLLDEIIVQVGSVTLGAGKPLFPRRVTNPPLRLLSAKAVGTGFAELRYEVMRK